MEAIKRLALLRLRPRSRKEEGWLRRRRLRFVDIQRVGLGNSKRNLGELRHVMNGVDGRVAGFGNGGHGAEGGKSHGKSSPKADDGEAGAKKAAASSELGSAVPGVTWGNCRASCEEEGCGVGAEPDTGGVAEPDRGPDGGATETCGGLFGQDWATATVEVWGGGVGREGGGCRGGMADG